MHSPYTNETVAGLSQSATDKVTTRADDSDVTKQLAMYVTVCSYCLSVAKFVYSMTKQMSTNDQYFQAIFFSVQTTIRTKYFFKIIKCIDS